MIIICIFVHLIDNPMEFFHHFNLVCFYSSLNMTPDYKIEEPKKYVNDCSSHRLDKNEIVFVVIMNSKQQQFNRCQNRHLHHHLQTMDNNNQNLFRHLQAMVSKQDQHQYQHRQAMHHSHDLHRSHQHHLRQCNQNHLVTILSFQSTYHPRIILAAGKPSSNFNAQPTPRSGNRVSMRGAKGSAALNPNENINQNAICYACGVTIR